MPPRKSSFGTEMRCSRSCACLQHHLWFDSYQTSCEAQGLIQLAKCCRKRTKLGSFSKIAGDRGPAVCVTGQTRVSVSRPRYRSTEMRHKRMDHSAAMVLLQGWCDLKSIHW